MPDVHPTPDGRLAVELEPAETELLIGLLGEYRDLLATPDSTDPVIERLFPRAFDDDEHERSWQSLVGGDLAAHKKALAQIPVQSEMTLDGEAASEWLALLTDLRLAIGTRLQVTEQMMSQPLDQAHPHVHAMAALHWLGWLQELIIEALG